MNSVITKMECFAIIVNGFQPLALVAKGSILIIVGSWIYLFLVITLLQKHSVGSNLKGWLCIYAYLNGKYLNKLEKHILVT